jgi:short-subunit dehydrogenase
MQVLENRVAVITGAASGIGRAIAIRLAKEKCALALVDINKDTALGLSRLDECAGLCEPFTSSVSVHRTDVSDRIGMSGLPEEIVARHGGVNLLVNNAGVSLAGCLNEISIDDFEWIVGVNFWGAVYGCKYFLPALERSGEGHIVNVLSDFALIGLPTKTWYCATKFALRGFSEALRAELAGSGIGVTAVYPGPVATAIIANGRNADPEKAKLELEFIRQRAIDADAVARRVVQGIKRNSARVLIGKETYLIDLATRLAPTATAALVAKMRKRIPFL